MHRDGRMQARLGLVPCRPALRQRCACCWCDRRKARQLPAVAAAAAQAARRRAWGWRGHCSLALHLCLCPWQCRACSSCELVLQQLQGGTALCAAGARGCRRKRPALGQRPPRDRLQRMHAAHPGRSNARGAPCCLRRLLLGLGPGSHRVALLPCGIACTSVAGSSGGGLNSGWNIVTWWDS